MTLVKGGTLTRKKRFTYFVGLASIPRPENKFGFHSTQNHPKTEQQQKQQHAEQNVKCYWHLRPEEKSRIHQKGRKADWDAHRGVGGTAAAQCASLSPVTCSLFYDGVLVQQQFPSASFASRVRGEVAVYLHRFLLR